MKKIIAISGKAGSGKDTVFEIIKKEQSTAVRIAFSEVLKNVVSAFVGERVNKDRVYKTARGDMTGRELLQIIGTEVFRNNFHRDVWASVCFFRIKKLLKDTDLAVVTDLRFNNEAEWLLKLVDECDAEVHFIRVDRPSLSPSDTHNHISEKALDQKYFGHILSNDGNLSELEKKIIKHIKSI